MKGDALLIAKVIITFQLVSLLIDKVDHYLSPRISSYLQGDYYNSPCITSYWQRWLLPFISYLLLLAEVIITFHLVSLTLLAKVIITFHLVSPLIGKVIITFCLVSFTLWAKVIITFQLVSWTLLAKVIITIHLVVLIRQWPSLSRNQPTFLLVNITIRLVPQGQIHIVC